MSAKTLLQVCLCVEDVDNCQLLLSQIGSGHVFGPNQYLHLILKTREEDHEVLKADLLDCAFPLIHDISTVSSTSTSYHPDIILVMLGDRPHTEINQYSNSPTALSDLSGLAHFCTDVANELSGWNLVNSNIVLLGDLAHVGASLFSTRLREQGTCLAARQIVAISGTKDLSECTHYPRSRGQMSKTTMFCEVLCQWWSGEKVTDKVILGTKYMDIKRQTSPTEKAKNSEYFFSTSVDLIGPMTFITEDLLSSSLVKVKVKTDMAQKLSRQIHDEINKSFLHVAHL